MTLHRFMRTALVQVTAAVLVLATAAPGAAETDPAGRSWMVLEAGSQRTVLEHNPHTERPIASLTKLMTALLTHSYLEKGKLYPLTDDERRVFDRDFLTRRKVLEMMLVPSNNRITRTAARLVSGDTASFVELMNLRAEELGMDETVYANPSGLPDSDPHYSTAEDLSLLLEEFLSHPELARISRHEDIQLNGVNYRHTLSTLRSQVPGVGGFKTGWTRSAGRCYVLELERARQSYHIIWLGSDSRAAARDQVAALADRLAGSPRRASY